MIIFFRTGGNLIKHHILNAINHGSFNSSGEVIDVLILDRAGSSAEDKEKKERLGGVWHWPWQTVCKIMTDMVKATKYQ